MKSTRLYLITGLLTVLFVTCTTTQHATNGSETTGAPAFWESADSLTSTCNAALERTRNLQRQARDASEPNESSVLKPYNDMVESFERTAEKLDAIIACGEMPAPKSVLLTREVT